MREDFHPTEWKGMGGRILVVGRAPEFTGRAAAELERAGLQVVRAHDGAEVRRALAGPPPDAIALDLPLPDPLVEGLLGAKAARRPMVVLTGSSAVEAASECLRLGARDFVLKPFEGVRLVVSVRNAVTHGELLAKLEALTRGDGIPDSEILPFREQERRILKHALEHTGWNVQEAARCLGIGRATVYRKIDRYGLRTQRRARDAS